jgi:acyl-coenzyme A synthetase/AMP-(fatty) acid ligase
MKDDGLVKVLAEFVISRLGESRRLSAIQFVPDLPHLQSGKLDRIRLRDLLA